MPIQIHQAQAAKLNKRRLGNSIEKYVAEYLRRLGYTILHLNWTAQYAELDIIALNRLVLVFVEVKYSSCSNFNPLENMTPKKLAHLKRSISVYLNTATAKPQFKGIRLDVIGVSKQQSGHLALNHLRNISLHQNI